MGLVVILASASFGDVSAESKTYTKDANGRVLVYRAESLKLDFFRALMATMLGPLFLYDSVTDNILGGLIFHNNAINRPRGYFFDKAERFSSGVFGILGMCNAVKLWKWCCDYDSYKPVMVIDKYGISYEGRKKILWKRAPQWEHQGSVGDSFSNVFFDLLVNPKSFDTRRLTINTDTQSDNLTIYQQDIAITLEELEGLIDEAYSEYKKSEQEKKIN